METDRKDPPPARANRVTLRAPACFIENRGQFRDQHGEQRDEVLFMYAENDFHLQLRAQGFSYELIRNAPATIHVSEADARGTEGTAPGYTPPPRMNIASHRVDVELAGATFGSGPYGLQNLGISENYYFDGKHSTAALNARGFGAVIYRDVYPGIDLVFAVGTDTDAARVKYSFIVRPGADPSVIRMKYHGAVPVLGEPPSGVFLGRPETRGESATMRLALSTGDITETVPLSFFVPLRDAERVMRAATLPGGARETTCVFTMRGADVSFEAPVPQGDSVLVIDPTLMWATYYGGAFGEEANDVAVDALGNVYAAGASLSTMNIATSGTFQSSYAGMGDAYVVKFNPAGIRLWGTYIGGGGTETAYAIEASASNSVLIAGVTTSTAGIATPGAFQTSHGGGTHDGMLVMLNASGARVWGTYVGGNASDYLYDAAMNANAQIAVSGTTTGSAGLASAGAHQSAYGGGSGDAVVWMFGSGGNRIWSSYYGGAAEDLGFGVFLNSGGTVFLTGATHSTSGIATAGGYQSVSGGGQDAFIAEFSAAGVLQEATYFGGSAGETGRDCAQDANGNLLLVGSTSSTSGIATSGAFKSAYQTNGDGFLAKFTSISAIGWATYLGGTGTDDAMRVAADVNSNLFVAGFTGSISGIATTGVHQPNPGGMLDAFVMKFSAAGNLDWASYFGGAADDRAFGVDITSTGHAVISGSTSSNSGIASSGAHQPGYGGQQDGFIARFFGSASGIDIIIQDIDKDTLCAGEQLTVYYAAAGIFQSTNIFMLELSNGFGVWSAPVTIGQVNSTGSGAIVGTIPTNTPSGGNYRVRIVSTEPPFTSADNGAEIVIIALPDTGISLTGSPDICLGDSVRLCAAYQPTYTYQWQRNGVPLPGAVQSCFVARDSGAFTVTITNQGRCPLTSSPVRIRLAAAPAVNVLPADSARICSGDTLDLFASFTPGARLQWMRDGTDLPGDTLAGLQTAVAGIYAARAESSNGCTTVSNPVRVTVHPRPLADVLPAGPIHLCNEDSVQLQASANPGASYQWSRDGVNLAGEDAPALRVRSPGAYSVLVTNAAGCSTLSSSVLVTRDTVPVPRVRPSGPLVICEGDSIELAAEPSGAWQTQWSRDGSPIAGATRNMYTVTQPGSYMVTFTVNPGCKATSTSVIVDVQPRPSVSIQSQRRDACEGDSIVVRSVVTPGTSIQWLKDGSELPGETRDSLLVRASGVYSVRVRNTFGCAAVSTMLPLRFERRPTAAFVVQGANPACEGDTIILRATGEAGVLYQWLIHGAPVPDTGSVYQARTSGFYRLVASRDGVCPDTSAGIQVTFKPRPSVAATGPHAVCVGTRAVYRTTPGLGHAVRWSLSGGVAESWVTGDSLRVHWSAPLTGRVRLQITDTLTGCMADTIIDVIVAPSLTPRITADRGALICLGDSVTLDAGADYATYYWNTGDTTRRIVIRTAGAYSVRVEDIWGCSGSSPPLSFFIQQPPAPRVSPEGPFILCEGDSVLLDAGGGYAAYRWSTGDTTRIIHARASASLARYSVAVRDSIGCEGVSREVEVRGIPRSAASILASGPVEFCEGDSVRLRSDRAQMSYTWSNGDTTESILVKRSGLYVLTVGAGTGCSSSDTIAVIVHAIPDTTIRGPRSLCIGSEAEYVVGASAGARYRWVGPGKVVDDTGLVKVRFTFSTAGRYTITLDIDAPGPCDGHAEISVVVGNTLDVILDPPGDITLCAGDSARLAAPPGYPRYRWSTGDTTEAIVVRAAGRYAVEVSDDHGCSGISDTVLVRQLPAPQPVLVTSPGTAPCLGDSVTLRTNEQYLAYRWSTGSTDPSIVLRSNATVRVIVTDSNGCEGESADKEILFLPRIQPRITASGPLEFCEGDSVLLGVQGTYAAYRWSSGDTSASILVKSSGVYHVDADSASSCGGRSDTVRVIVYPRPATPTLLLQGGTTLVTDTAAVYRWYRDGILLDGETTSRLLLRGAGSYLVEVENQFGCTARSEPFVFTPAREVITWLRLPVIEASPGDKIDVQLVVTNASNFTRGIRSFDGVISFRSDVLMPVGVAYADSDGVRKVPISGRDVSVDGDAIFTFKATVMLGTIASTRLRLESFGWDGSRVIVFDNDGELRVRICEEGGARLFDGARALMLSGRPNPFNASTVISYQLIESGYTTVRVFDALGRSVAVLCDGYMQAGAHSQFFDASALASGVYTCVLTTPGLTAYIPLHVVK